MNKALSAIKGVVGVVPDGFHTEVQTRLINHMLKGQAVREQLSDLDGKRVSIYIRDIDTELLFELKSALLVPVRGRRGDVKWDVRISGDFSGFWQLATRTEDPDTLFFNRQLDLEGETETGLYLKNILDGLDFDPEAHLNAVFGPKLGRTIFRILQQSGIDDRLRRRMGLPAHEPVG
ncbi:MAG: SCP2 sterol-binding domain-containing protein [Gammaproteobacteria bacterium]|nr:SCP2 sterol-binding domain-containing protein [Gammaproteobacteria bacterium]